MHLNKSVPFFAFSVRPFFGPGNAAPWLGKPGGGTQYQLPMSIDELLKEGFIKPIK
ncbi:TPA: glycohydrolase toxin TNT-related protein [Pseudomonas putida]|nr:glycohydrolase toxin TNT-related protein [Pseudomonas putida]